MAHLKTILSIGKEEIEKIKTSDSVMDDRKVCRELTSNAFICQSLTHLFITFHLGPNDSNTCVSVFLYVSDAVPLRRPLTGLAARVCWQVLVVS